MLTLSHIPSKDIVVYSVLIFGMDNVVGLSRPNKQSFSYFDEPRANVNYANEKTIKPLSYYECAVFKSIAL